MSKSDGVSQTSDAVTSSKYVDGINEENMDKFLAALRSGEFQQGQWLMNDSDEHFCCMGVMAELAHRDGAVSKDNRFSAVMYGGFDHLPPRNVVEWVGVPAENVYDREEGNGFVNIRLFNTGLECSKTYRDFVTASELNDTHGLSFAEIADLFEKEFLKEI